MNAKIIAYVAAVASLAVAAAYVVQSMQIDARDKELPSKWALASGSMSAGELKSKLGPPTQDLSAKSYLNWLEPGERNARLLKVICDAECASDEQVSQVVFLLVNQRKGKVEYQRVLYSRAK